MPHLENVWTTYLDIRNTHRTLNAHTHSLDVRNIQSVSNLLHYKSDQASIAKFQSYAVVAEALCCDGRCPTAAAGDGRCQAGERKEWT